MRKMKKLIAIVLCLVLLLALVSCSNSVEKGNPSADPSANPSAGGTGELINANNSSISGGANQDKQTDKVVYTMSSTSVSVAPFSPSSPGSVGKFALYGKLFYQPYYGAPIEESVPWLAKSYEMVDATTYKVELYDYIKDSKGNAITTDDVIWSYETSNAVGQFVDFGSLVDNIEKVDDYNMIFHMASAAPNSFVAITTHGQLCIVDKDWYEGASDEERSTNPAATGPYTVKEFVSGSKAVLEANDDYWQKDNKLNEGVLAAYRNVKEVTYTAITEPSMRVIALQNGEVDVAGVNASDLENFYDIEKGEDLPGWTVSIPAPTYCHSLFPNMDGGSIVGQSLELRKAIFYALDSESIMFAAGLNDKVSAPLKAFGVPIYQGYQEKWAQDEYWDYNPTKAAECLAAAGYKPGEVTITLLSSTANFSDSVRSVIISQLEAVGINVDNLAVEQALFSTYKNDSTAWDIMLDLKQSSSGHIASIYTKSFSAENFAEGQGGANFWKDERMYELLKAMNDDATDENVDAVEQHLRENAAVTGVYCSGVINVAQGGIEEIGFAGNLLEPAANIYADDYVSAANK